MRLSAVTLALTCLCALKFKMANAVTADELSFPMIAASNATRQWSLNIAVGTKGSPLTTVACNAPAMNACPDQPVLQYGNNHIVQIGYTLATPRGNNGTDLITYQGAQPTVFQLRICFTLAASVDRAWRKKNKPYPRLSQNCPYTVLSVPFNGSATNVNKEANSGVGIMELDNWKKNDEITSATWFTMAWVFCGNTVCAFESTEGNATAPAPAPGQVLGGRFFQTKAELGITPGMRAAAIVLSIFGPVFFIIFWFADSTYYKKTGKPIRF